MSRGLAAKFICFHCVGEVFLRNEVGSSTNKRACSYCRRVAAAFPIGEVADRVEAAFRDHYQQTPTDPDFYEQMLLKDKEFEYYWQRRGEPVIDAIADAAGIPEDAAADIHRQLEERHRTWGSDHGVDGEDEFDVESCYEERGADGRHWHLRWHEFDWAIKTQARHFGHNAKELLTEMFSSVDQISGPNHPLVMEIGPDSEVDTLYRARVFQTDDDDLRGALCQPDLHLGPPPSSVAPDGRMNARGVSVFYGATEAEVAIAEVRPPVGARVVVAQFEIVRPLKVLNLDNLRFASVEGSIFDPSFADLRNKVEFLRSLSERLCAPVVPDLEDLEYVPTQAIADFLGTERDPPLDGIVYPSTQTVSPGLNVVLFHGSSRVEALTVPKDVSLEATTEDPDEEGIHPSYHVWVEKSDDSAGRAREVAAVRVSDQFDWPWRVRQSTLKVVVDALVVHHITGTEVISEPHNVTGLTEFAIETPGNDHDPDLGLDDLL